MNRVRLVTALSQSMPALLATDLVDSYLTIRRDVTTRTLGRSAPGKFVETLVQVLQHMATGRYEAQPDVDRFFRQEIEQHAQLDDGVRICGARIARGMYRLRNKRNIAHKNSIDPNSYDLQLLHADARWILAELLRLAHGVTMEEAGALIDMLHEPVGRIVERIHDRDIVHGDGLTAREELLVLLHDHYPNDVEAEDIVESLDRRNPDAVKKQLRKAYEEKLVQGNTMRGYRLTSTGFGAAERIISKLMGAPQH